MDRKRFFLLSADESSGEHPTAETKTARARHVFTMVFFFLNCGCVCSPIRPRGEPNPVAVTLSTQGMFVEAQNFGSFASGPPFAQLVPWRHCLVNQCLYVSSSRVEYAESEQFY